MQSCDLVELAALISAEGPGLLRGGGRFDASGIDAYWTASKCRFERWSRRLKACGGEIAKKAEDGTRSVPATLCLATCSEVLTSEILTRIWAAAAAADDQMAGQSELGPVAQSVLFGHQEARHRVLSVIAAGRQRDQCREGMPLSAGKLDQLRRVCERWTDLLLAPLAKCCEIERFAHDPARVADFAHDRIDEPNSPHGLRARQILGASLQATFRGTLRAPSGNADLNEQVAAAILQCLNLDRLEASGVRLESPTYGWLFHARVESAAGAAERMVADLLDDERRP